MRDVVIWIVLCLAGLGVLTLVALVAAFVEVLRKRGLQ